MIYLLISPLITCLCSVKGVLLENGVFILSLAQSQEIGWEMYISIYIFNPFFHF